jgi:hypothetical protein
MLGYAVIIVPGYVIVKYVKRISYNENASKYVYLGILRVSTVVVCDPQFF